MGGGRRRGGFGRGGGDGDGDEDFGDEGFGGGGRRGSIPQPRILNPIDVLEGDEDAFRWLTRTEFQLQFAWVPVPEADRVDEEPLDPAAPTQAAGTP